MKAEIKALLLTVCFLFFVSVCAYAAEEAEGGFFVYQFSARDNGAEETYAPYKIIYSDITGKGTKKLALEIKEYLDNMPEGRRCIDITYISHKMTEDKDDYIFWDKGVANVNAVMDSLFSELKAADASIDYVIDDFEEEMSNWVVGNLERSSAIEKNPRYKKEIRPLLEEAGYAFSDDERTELYNIVDIGKHETAYLIWNGVMERRKYSYYKEAITDPVLKYYPDVKTSNYGAGAISGENKLYDSARHKIYLGGRSVTSCTHCSPVLYGGLAHISFEGRTPEEYPFNQFKKTAYNALVYDLIKPQEAIYASGKGIMPWITLVTNKDALHSQNAYYDELIFHLGMLNADPFLSFNHTPDGSDESIAEGEKYLGELIAELNEIVGTGKRRTLLKDRMSYNTQYILNGLETEDKSVWRITPDLYVPGISKESFLIDKDKLIFQIGQQVVCFPDGSYIVERDKEDYGYWVISPKGTRPVELELEALTPVAAPVLNEDNIPSGKDIPYDYIKYEPNMNTAVEETNQSITGESQEAEETKTGNITQTVKSGHWADKALEAAVRDGIIKGTENGLEPDRNVTAAEFCTMALRAMGIEAEQAAGNKWYVPIAQKTLELGWIDTADNITADMTRAEAADVTARMLALNKTANEKTFSDIDGVSEKIKASISKCSAVGIIEGYPDGSFKPYNTITRAEAVIIIQRAVK